MVSVVYTDVRPSQSHCYQSKVVVSYKNCIYYKLHTRKKNYNPQCSSSVLQKSLDALLWCSRLPPLTPVHEGGGCYGFVFGQLHIMKIFWFQNTFKYSFELYISLEISLKL